MINIKKAIGKLKEDISHLNLEMGLLNYSLDQDYLRQASIYAEIESNGWNKCVGFILWMFLGLLHVKFFNFHYLVPCSHSLDL